MDNDEVDEADDTVLRAPSHFGRVVWMPQAQRPVAIAMRRLRGSIHCDRGASDMGIPHDLELHPARLIIGNVKA